jgi:acetyltransferase-like isoleucine patch superfamily enzyme
MFFFHRVWIGISVRLFRLFFAPFLKSCGRKSYIRIPTCVMGIRNIVIGENVGMGRGVFLAAVPHTGARECLLEIGDGAYISSFCHIYATTRISIGKNVMVGNGSYIADNTHEYVRPDIAIALQPVRQLSVVSIGDGSWLGFNVCVMGVQIGKNCVIGANSVVTKDIPDFSVAVGAPARIVKRYDEAAGAWRKTDPTGAFLD